MVYRGDALDVPNPNAMYLATVDADGTPSVRTVLRRGFDERGVVFYTNYESRKSSAMVASGRASVLFHWDQTDRQIRIEGASPKLNLKCRTRTSQSGTRKVSWALGPVNRASLCRTEPSLRKRSKPCGPSFWGHLCRDHRSGVATASVWMPSRSGRAIRIVCTIECAGPLQTMVRSLRRGCIPEATTAAEDGAPQLACRAFSSMRPQRSVNPPLMGASPSGPNSAQSKI